LGLLARARRRTTSSGPAPKLVGAPHEGWGECEDSQLAHAQRVRPEEGLQLRQVDNRCRKDELIEPIWEQFCALLPERDADVHPLGCHRRRIPDRLVFDKLVQVLVFGCAYDRIAYDRIAHEGCSASTLRRRRDEWIDSGAMEKLRGMALEAYDRIVGLELSEVAVDCCITKAPCGGESAGRNPIDRGKQGLKRSVVVDANGIPLGAISAPANRHDSPLLGGTLGTLGKLGPLPEQMSVHLDRGCDSEATRQRLRDRGLKAAISEKGKAAPHVATKRWVLETH
jgi:hypothetical protein